MTKLERTYEASPEEIWELWTTASGIESWWPPDGFTADVQTLDLRPGGELVYSFTAADSATMKCAWLWPLSKSPTIWRELEIWP